MLSVIVIKPHLVNVFNNNRPNSKQTLKKHTEKTSAQWTEYRKVKNKVTKMMRQAEAKYWHDQFSEATSTQDFWKTYRKATKKTINTRIGPLTSKDGKEVTDD